MHPTTPEDPRDLRIEALPDEVVAAMEVRDAWRRRLAANDDGLEFIVSGLAGWTPGSTVRVAFLGGDAALHRKIADATRQITEAANISLDFGETPAGEFRRWTESDTTYQAEIRVSFDQGGYFSLVGTDSTDRSIGGPFSPIGGGPGQRSLNLEGFPTSLPATWQGTTRHEFLHALAFQHEHQNTNAPCQADFRWDDDPGYIPTTNASGVFVADFAGRRPGIYTFLAGPPNRWPRAKVDHNLRPIQGQNLTASPFDPASVMLYRFAPLFYKTTPSPCAPTGNGIDLSAGDRSGLQFLYPHAEQAVKESAARASDALNTLTGLEGAGEPASPFRERVIELLESRANSGTAG